MDLRRETYVAELLDPRLGFERARLPVEIRWDPLTGESCRLLPAGSLRDPALLDLEELAARSRPDCPFCAGRVEELTTRFPPEVVTEGRIRRGEALLFPNLLAYSKWSSVCVYSPRRHLLPLDALDARLVSDNLSAQAAFARAAVAFDPGSAWVSVNANHLPPSGSSIFHPHTQGAANPVPTTMQRQLAEVPPARFSDYLGTERRLGERHVASTGRAEWLASFAPGGPAELRAFVPGVACPSELDAELTDELADGLARCFGIYAGLGFQSFNLALYGAPAGTNGYPLNLRLVGRAYYGPLLRSDAMWSERLHREAAVDIAPEWLAERARERFAAAT
jgi:galactose-1-phosphate uridylyltransferase